VHINEVLLFSAPFGEGMKELFSATPWKPNSFAFGVSGDFDKSKIIFHFIISQVIVAYV